MMPDRDHLATNESAALSEKRKMLAGQPYDAGDPELVADQRAALLWMERVNRATTLAADERAAILREGLGAFGPGSVIRSPFHCDYGYNIQIGAGVFLNFNCVILDVVRVAIGDRTQIGPGVQILAADHPRDPAERATGREWGRPITIGRNVWIGGGAMILPGVKIGDDAIIGAGSVVSRDVAPGVTVVGNPARPRPAA